MCKFNWPFFIDRTHFFIALLFFTIILFSLLDLLYFSNILNNYFEYLMPIFDFLSFRCSR